MHTTNADQMIYTGNVLSVLFRYNPGMVHP